MIKFTKKKKEEQNELFFPCAIARLHDDLV